MNAPTLWRFESIHSFGAVGNLYQKMHFVGSNLSADPKRCVKRGNASAKFWKTSESKAFSEIFGIRRMWNNSLRELWNIAPSSQCEIKFASSHFRSKYFTAELFHLAKPYFTRRRRISLKKAHIVLVDKCVLFSGADYGARTRHLDLGKVALYQMS